MKRLFCILAVCAVCSFGCREAAETPSPDRKDGVKVNAPGVHIEVKKDQGVTVEVPPKK